MLTAFSCQQELEAPLARAGPFCCRKTALRFLVELFFGGSGTVASYSS